MEFRLKKFFIAIVVCIICTAGTAFSAEQEVLKANLSIGADVGAQCNQNLAKDLLPINWKGVYNRRDISSVGVLKLRKEEVDVMSKDPVEKILDDGFKTMLQRCGVKFSKRSGIEVSVVLNEYFAGSKKGFIVGETEAKGSMTVYVKSSMESFEFQYGASKQDKGLKKKKITKLEVALNEVMNTMLDSVISTNNFFDALKEVSK